MRRLLPRTQEIGSSYLFRGACSLFYCFAVPTPPLPRVSVVHMVLVVWTHWNWGDLTGARLLVSIPGVLAMSIFAKGA